MSLVSLKESNVARGVDVVSFSFSPDSISRNQRSREITLSFSQSIVINLCQHGEAWGSRSRKSTCTYKLRVCDFVNTLTNTLTETGHSHVLDRICFESITNLGVECYFKIMRARHDMPTVANLLKSALRGRRYAAYFSYFTGPNSFYPEKIIKGKPPNIKTQPNKQSAITEGTGSKDEDTRRETVMREFDGEY